jgi:hypothetical protein
MIGTGRWRSEPPCARQGVPHGQTESGGIVLAGICWSPRAHRRCSLIPDRALCLPTFSHFLIANKTSLSLSLSLSLPRAHASLSLSLSFHNSRAKSIRVQVGTHAYVQSAGEHGSKARALLGQDKTRQEPLRPLATTQIKFTFIYLTTSNK